MSADPAALPGDSLPAEPAPLAVPDSVIADLEADVIEAKAAAVAISPAQSYADADLAQAAAEADHLKDSAVKRLQNTYATRGQSVKAQMRYTSILALVKAGHSGSQIAAMLNMKPNTVRAVIWRARKARVLNDLRDILEHESSALAVDAVNYHLRKKDKDVAIEHLKGVGLYKNHSNVKQEYGAPGFQMPPLQVNVVVQNQLGSSPVTQATFDVSEGAIGVPREDA